MCEFQVHVSSRAWNAGQTSRLSSVRGNVKAVPHQDVFGLCDFSMAKGLGLLGLTFIDLGVYIDRLLDLLCSH